MGWGTGELFSGYNARAIQRECTLEVLWTAACQQNNTVLCSEKLVQRGAGLMVRALSILHTRTGKGTQNLLEMVDMFITVGVPCIQ